MANAEHAGLAPPPHDKGGGAGIPGRLSSIFRRAPSGNDLKTANAMKGGKEPAASDDVLEVMRQLEESNAGLYMQAEAVMAREAAEEEKRGGRATRAHGGVGGEDKGSPGAGGGNKFSPSQYLTAM
jgi:hypothetical protein